MKPFFYLVFLVVSLFAKVEYETFLTPKEIAYLESKNPINICVQANFLPVEGIVNGNYVGVISEATSKILDRTRLNLNYVSSKDLKSLRENVINEKCEIVTVLLSEFNPYKNIFATKPYVKDSIVLITSSDVGFASNLDYLDGKKLVATLDVYKKIINEKFKNTEVIVLNTIEEAIDMVQKKEAYGFVTFSILANQIIQKYGYANLKINRELYENGYINVSLGVTNKDPMLLDILNKTISAIPKSEMENIKIRWSVQYYKKEIDKNLLSKIIVGFIFIVAIFVIWIFMTKRHNSQLKDIINSSIEALGIFENNRFLMANKQTLKLFGYQDFEQIKGKTPFFFVHESSHEILREKLKESQEPYELLMKKKDGTVFEALVKGTKLADKRFRVFSVVDLTDLKKVQNELEELNKGLETRVSFELEKNRQHQLIMFQQSRLALMGEMLSMIAHQWRQPLNILSLVLQNFMMKHHKKALDDEMVNSFYVQMQNQISQMTHTIDDFKNFFKPQKEMKTFLINDIINHSLEILKPAFDESKIDCDLDLKVKVECFGYPSELGQCLINILSNAKDALISNNIQKSKEVKIYTKNDENYVSIFISDNAGGIPAEIIGKIFEPYFSTKNEKEGTGLGLYMAKMIITEHMQGSISVSNNEQGALFEIMLPIRSCNVL